MELQKIINIFEEHGFNENNCSFFRQEDITDIAKDVLKAINFTHGCKSDSEQLCDKNEYGQIKKLYIRVGNEWVEQKKQ